jgi:hypothetical protein
LIKIKGAVSLLVALAFFGGCRIVPTQTVPPNIKDQFAKVAQELRSFPPGFVFGSDYMESPNNVPGAAEYEALIQSNQAVSALLALLKDRDSKIRTLAAAALVSKGERRLQQYLGPLLDDQSQTFDQMYRPPVDNPTEIKFLPQTVATAVCVSSNIRTRPLSTNTGQLTRIGNTAPIGSSGSSVTSNS